MELLFSLLRFASPVALGALGETIQQRSGVMNIGLEGMMLTSAFFALMGTKWTGSPWLGLLVGVAAALVLGVIQAWFTIYQELDQVVVGTAVNLFALGLTGTLFRSLFGASGQLLSVPTLPKFFGGADVFIVLIPLASVLLWWVLRDRRWGLAVRATGEYPAAVQSAGLKPRSLRMQAALVGSVFAGLAGSYYTLGITGSFAENTIAGRGFVAIAMVTFGRWNPIGVLLASLLVGLAEQSQFWLQTLRTGLPYQVFAMLPYLIALAVLIVAGKGTQAPQSLGRPLPEGSR